MYTKKSKLLKLIREILNNETSLFLLKEYLKDLKLDDDNFFETIESISSYVVCNVNIINNYLSLGIVDYSKYSDIESVLYLLSKVQSGCVGIIKDKIFEIKNKKNYDQQFLSIKSIPKYQEKIDEFMLILGFDK